MYNIDSLPHRFSCKINNLKDREDFCISLYENYGVMFYSYKDNRDYTPIAFIRYLLHNNINRTYIIMDLEPKRLYIDNNYNSSFQLINFDEIDFNPKKTNAWLLRQKRLNEQRTNNE